MRCLVQNCVAPSVLVAVGAAVSQLGCAGVCWSMVHVQECHVHYSTSHVWSDLGMWPMGDGQRSKSPREGFCYDSHPPEPPKTSKTWKDWNDPKDWKDSKLGKIGKIGRLDDFKDVEGLEGLEDCKIRRGRIGRLEDFKDVKGFEGLKGF